MIYHILTRNDFTMNVQVSEQHTEVVRRTSNGSIGLIPIGSALHRGT